MKKQLLKSALMAVVGVGLLAGSAMALSFTSYNNYSDWLSAIDPTVPVVENFADATLEPGFTITEVNGTGTIFAGVYKNIVDVDTNRYQIFELASGMTGWAGWFDLSPGGEGTAIDIYINDDNTKIATIPASTTAGFYSFVTSSTFYGLRLQDANLNGALQETYFSVDMAMAPAPVPEPATMLLFGTGIAGLAGIARRRKAN